MIDFNIELFKNREWIKTFSSDSDYSQFKSLRHDIYSRLGGRKDAALDLVDSLSSQVDATSVTDLSSSTHFKRQYASVNDAISYAATDTQNLKQFLQNESIKATDKLYVSGQKFIVLSLDSTPMPHPHAKCLEDRSYIHDASNSVTGKPINIGHEYSAVIGVTSDKSWVTPVELTRIPSDKNPAVFGINQIAKISKDFKEQPFIVLMDSRYNSLASRICIHENINNINKNTVFIVRSQCNRIYFKRHDSEADPKKRGRKKIYGAKVDPHDLLSSIEPDKKILVGKEGEGCIVIAFWKDVITKQRGLPEDKDPSDIVIIREMKADGTPKYKRSLVLRVYSKGGFDAEEATWLYLLRFRIESFFKVLKNNFLFGKFQSPELTHQETFVSFIQAAYLQLYFSKNYPSFTTASKPWLRYPLANPKNLKLSPTNLQRSFSKFLNRVGTPSTYKPPRHIPEGRQTGYKQTPRTEKPVIKKNKESKETINKNIPSMDTEIRDEAIKLGVDELITQKNQNIFKNLTNVLCLLFFLILNAFPSWYQGPFLNFQVSEFFIEISDNPKIDDFNSAIFQFKNTVEEKNNSPPIVYV